jgi:hypothetical protein
MIRHIPCYISWYIAWYIPYGIYHGIYHGSRCAALGTEPVNVHFWLEQIIHEFHGQGIANGVTQGQYMRRLLHGQLRTELDTRISQMPAIAQAIRDQVATLDHHYAVALASCCSHDDNLLCHHAATNPRRNANEPLSQATARAEQAFRGAAALGCVLPPSLQFWAVYGILTQERVTFTTQPGIPDRLIRQLAEQPTEATARYAALVHELLAWARTQTTRAPSGTGHGGGSTRHHDGSGGGGGGGGGSGGGGGCSGSGGRGAVAAAVAATRPTAAATTLGRARPPPPRPRPPLPPTRTMTMRPTTAPPLCRRHPPRRRKPPWRGPGCPRTTTAATAGRTRPKRSAGDAPAFASNAFRRARARPAIPPTRRIPPPRLPRAPVHTALPRLPRVRLTPRAGSASPG